MKNQNDFKRNTNNILSLSNILILIAYLSPLLTTNGLIFSNISALIITGCTLFLWNSKKFYLILPIYIFFYSQLILPFGIASFRIYSILLFIKILFSNNIKLEKRHFIPLLIIILYSLFVISFVDLRISLVVIFDILLIILYISNFLKKNIELFFYYFVFAAITSSIFGLLSVQNGVGTHIKVNNTWIEVNRFIGSFSDPNYLGFFLNIAIFAVLILNVIVNKTAKRVLLLLLFLSLIATLSVTGLLCNIFFLLIFLIVKGKSNFKFSFLLMLIIGFIYFNYQTLLSSNIPIISDFFSRIESELQVLNQSNLGSLTSNRSTIWEEHLAYFFTQPLDNILFGGNFVTDYGYDNQFNGVSHQAFIDMLLNFGFIGTLLLVIFFIYTTFNYARDYFRKRKEEFLFLVIIKGIWFVYAFSLSMFPSWMFNLFFFL